MNSRIAQRIRREGIGRDSERYQGQIHGVGRMGASRMGALVLSASYSQPVNAEEISLQDGNGAFYFLAGYSALGGDDVLP